MKKKNWIFTGIAILLVMGASLTLGSSSPATQPIPKDNPTCCCQKMKECKSQSASPAKMTSLDNLSHQFLVLFSPIH